MICLTSEELKVFQNLSGNQDPHIIFKGKVYTERLCFSKNNRQSATNFCRYYDEDNILCLLVEKPRYYSVFVEKQTILKTKTLSQPKHDEKTAKTPSTITKENIEGDFLNRCQQELANLIGPIASIVCQQTLSQNTEISRDKFIEALAKQIPDQKNQLDFKQRLLS